MVSYGPSRGRPGTGRYGNLLSEDAERGFTNIGRLARHALAPLAGVLVGLNAIGQSLLKIAINSGYTTESFRMANREFYKAKVELSKVAVEAIAPVLEFMTYLINKFNSLPKSVKVGILVVFLFATAVATVLAPIALLVGYMVPLILQMQRWALWGRVGGAVGFHWGAGMTAAAAGTNLFSKAMLFMRAAAGPWLIALGLVALVIWEIVRALRSGSDEMNNFTDAQRRAAGDRRGNENAKTSSPRIGGDAVGPYGPPPRQRPGYSWPRWSQWFWHDFGIGGRPSFQQPSPVPGPYRPPGASSGGGGRPGWLDWLFQDFGEGRGMGPSGSRGSGPNVQVAVYTQARDPEAVAKVVDRMLRQRLRNGSYTRDLT